MAKPKLLILSDIFGGKNPEWIKYYTNALASKFEIQYYDVLELANIEVFNRIETDIHNQFLCGGIDNAIETLLKLETDKVIVLGFSIGGTIAWKTSFKGLNATHLFAVSSTRLRYETEVPSCAIKLYFGDQDLNKPNSKWFLDLNVNHEIFQNQQHHLYLEEKNAAVICTHILKLKL